MLQKQEISPQGLAFRFWPLAPNSPNIPAKPPIVVLHGLLGSHKIFASFAQAFSSAKHGYPVLCIDVRNHGASFHSERFDYPAMAQDMEQLLDWLENQEYGAVNWRRVVVLGHSMGGRTAMMYALLYPRRLAALISVDVVPSLENPDISIGQIVAAMRGAAIAQAPGRKDVEAILRTELHKRGTHSEAVLQFLLLCNLQGSAGAYRWGCNLETIETQLGQIVRWPAHYLEQKAQKDGYGDNGKPCNASLPLLLIAGGRSPYVQAQGWELLLQYFPHSPKAPTVKKVIESAYHWPHTETPQEFQNLVAEFLGQL